MRICKHTSCSAGAKFALATDIGCVRGGWLDAIRGCAAVLLESNYDPEALACGPYPYHLKQRIAGPYGHLSHQDASAFAVQLAKSGTSQIILAHLSHENNSPAIAHYTTEIALSAAGLQPALSVAPRDSLSETYTLSGRTVCRK